uniref:ATPase H+ transporting accessory protein 1 like n=1 Tax=Serinus canaria TaxID=9135 RepID=A0A8C9N1T2_SERCA
MHFSCSSSDRNLLCGPSGCQLQLEQGRTVARSSLEPPWAPPQPRQPPERHHQRHPLHPVLGQEDPDQVWEPQPAGSDRQDLWSPRHRGCWGLKLQRGQRHVRGILLCWEGNCIWEWSRRVLPVILSVQSWFSLPRLQLLSLQRHEALLVPSSENDLSHLWEVTFIDFQIQGFNIQEGHFAYARDCAAFFSPAILMGMVMSLVLLLVLAYALHMLIHLKSLDRHYECKAPPAYFAQMKDSDMGDEKEPLRSSGNESYELRNQQFGKIYI